MTRFYGGYDPPWQHDGCNKAIAIVVQREETLIDPTDPRVASNFSSILQLQNFPNPFNPTTTISFFVTDKIRINKGIELSVYNIRGHHIRTLLKHELDPGFHRVIWDGKNDYGQQVSSGIYLYNLRCDGKSYMKKMVMVE